MIPIVIAVLATVTKGLMKEVEDLEIRGRVEIIQNNSIVEIGHNTKKSPGDLKVLALGKHHQLKLA